MFKLETVREQIMNLAECISEQGTSISSLSHLILISAPIIIFFYFYVLYYFGCRLAEPSFPDWRLNPGPLQLELSPHHQILREVPVSTPILFLSVKLQLPLHLTVFPPSRFLLLGIDEKVKCSKEFRMAGNSSFLSTFCIQMQRVL